METPGIEACRHSGETRMHGRSFSKSRSIALLIVLGIAASRPALAQMVVRAAEVPALTEGPTVDRDGSVYFTELRSERIFKLANNELMVFREKSHAANGMVIDPQGRLIVCEGAADGESPRITRTDLRTGASEVLASSYQGMPFRGANDVTLDNRGRIYFTDPGGSAVYRIDAPGQVARVLAAPDIERPNGIQIAPDDRTLYVIESGAAPAGPRMIRAFELQADGSARNGRVLFDFPGRSADGMSVDTQGNLYVSAGLNALAPPGALAAARVWTADALKSQAGVYVISPMGTLITFIPIPEDVITNNTFGGADMRTLYVTAGRTLFQVRTDIAGLPR
jgi:gluconolactonase